MGVEYMKIATHSSTPKLMMMLCIGMVLLNIIPMNGHFGWPCEYDFQFHFRNGIPLGFGFFGLVGNVVVGSAGVLLAGFFWEVALHTDETLRRRAKARRVGELRRAKKPDVPNENDIR